ncbi:MAG: NUDIX hydrolase [Cytophagaceae bacterium]|nr:NUDIX hydrolase [Cytophagaceae bacterium]
MHRKPLLDLLYNYEAFDDIETEYHGRIIRFVSEHPDCFERTLAVGHVTGSAWIVDPARQQTVLLHHLKLDRWFQPGGHCDGDSDVQRVAFREANEETNLVVKPIDRNIFDLDIHRIPGNSREAAHLHYDVRFLLEADPSQPLMPNSESKALAWVPLEKVVLYNPDASLMRMVAKSLLISRE